MPSKFRHFEESRIQLGVGEVHIQEVDDGVHLTISEEIDHSIRLGIPGEHGMSYDYWRNIVKKLKDEKTIFSVDDSVEMSDNKLTFDEEDEKQDASETSSPMRPELVRYKDKKDVEWVAIKLICPNGDPVLVSWEVKTDVPIPVISFNLDLVNKAKKIGRTTFYEELKAICDRILE